MAKLLSAQSIENREFKTVRLSQGYSPDEVDAFLDEVGSTVRELYYQLGEFQRKQNDHPTQVLSTRSAEKLLDVAQRAADEMEAEANHKAGTIVAEATVKAQKIEADAKRQADVITAGAYTRKDEISAQLDKLIDHRERAVRAHEAALKVLKEAQ